MKNGGIDKRIIKSQNAIREAFKTLINEREMGEITICDITNLAHVTRSTFYLYYKTVSDVRDDIENIIIHRIKEIMDDTDFLTSMVNPYPLLKNVATEITNEDKYNRYILSSKCSGTLMDKICNLLVDNYIKFTEANNMNVDLARAKYIAAFIGAGIMEDFRIWYNHQSTLTLEEMCQRMSNIISSCLKFLSEKRD